MMINLEKLNSECFTYENYESDWWNALDLAFDEALNHDRFMGKIVEYAVGYCSGASITVRPRNGTYAVMFEKDGERFWFHVAMWEFEE